MAKRGKGSEAGRSQNSRWREPDSSDEPSARPESNVSAGADLSSDRCLASTQCRTPPPPPPIPKRLSPAYASLSSKGFASLSLTERDRSREHKYVSTASGSRASLPRSERDRSRSAGGQHHTIIRVPRPPSPPRQSGTKAKSCSSATSWSVPPPPSDRSNDLSVGSQSTSRVTRFLPQDLAWDGRSCPNEACAGWKSQLLHHMQRGRMQGPFSCALCAQDQFTHDSKFWVCTLCEGVVCEKCVSMCLSSRIGGFAMF